MGLFDFLSDIKDPTGKLNDQQKKVNTNAGNFLSTATPDTFRYGGQMVADLTGEEQKFIDEYTRQSSARRAALDSIISGNTTGFNDQFTNEIVNPTMSDFTRNIQPLIEEALPTFSTARGKAVANALTDITGNLAQQRFNARSTARDQAIRASGELSSAGASEQSVVSIPRSIQQAKLDKSYENFVTANSQYQSSVNAMLQYIGIDTGTVTENPTAKILGMAARAAAAYFSGGQSEASGMGTELSRLSTPSGSNTPAGVSRYVPAY